MFSPKIYLGMALAMLITNSAPACDPSFRLINSTSWALRGVYVRSSGSQNWGEELLGDNVFLNAGRRSDINLDDTDTVRFDLKMVFIIDELERNYLLRNIILCEVSTLDVLYSSDSGFKTLLRRK